MRKTVMLFLFFTLSGVATPSHADSTSALAKLPPDPGSAGKATLAGIDSDHDGVRDDVQRWIAIHYPNSQKARAALTQMTKTMQQYLLNAANPVQLFNIAAQMDKDTDCLSYVLPNNFYQVSIEHEAIFLNTPLRSRTWMQADHQLSGKMSPADLPYASWKLGCNFNPDAMPN